MGTKTWRLVRYLTLPHVLLQEIQAGIWLEQPNEMEGTWLHSILEHPKKYQILSKRSIGISARYPRARRTRKRMFLACVRARTRRLWEDEGKRQCRYIPWPIQAKKVD